MTTDLTNPSHVNNDEEAGTQRSVRTKEFKRLLKIRKAVTQENFEDARLEDTDSNDHDEKTQED
jgi:hypothetical protein